MGKRSGNFDRIEKDFYPTIDLKAGQALAKYYENNPLKEITYSEPCYGDGHLVRNLSAASSKLKCVHYSDVSTGTDAFSLEQEDLNNAMMIVTNPPWTRKILHPMIEHFVNLSPSGQCWLLFDAGWMHTKQSSELISKYCTTIVSIGRLQWIEGTNMTGKDDCAWYEFRYFGNGTTTFIGR